jgi:hypothetical protein
MSEIKMARGLMVRTLVAMAARSFVGYEQTVPANTWGFLRDGKVDGEPVWIVSFGDLGAVKTEAELRDPEQFELRDEPALPQHGGELFSVPGDATLELETSDWPLHIHSSASSYADGSGLVAKFDLPTGSVGDDDLAATQMGWARHTVACINVCRGLTTTQLEEMGKGAVVKRHPPKFSASQAAAPAARHEVPGLSSASKDMRRLVFMLTPFLEKLGHGSLMANVQLDQQSDTEWGLYLKDAGIGIDVGYDVMVNTVSGKVTKPGFRVYTMQVVNGGRWHPDEDVDVTRVETLSTNDVLTCIGGLLAELSLNFMPDLPEDLAYPEPVLEEV